MKLLHRIVFIASVAFLFYWSRTVFMPHHHRKRFLDMNLARPIALNMISFNDKNQNNLENQPSKSDFKNNPNLIQNGDHDQHHARLSSESSFPASDVDVSNPTNQRPQKTSTCWHPR